MVGRTPGEKKCAYLRHSVEFSLTERSQKGSLQLQRKIICILQLSFVNQIQMHGRSQKFNVDKDLLDPAQENIPVWLIYCLEDCQLRRTEAAGP
jgi:hypothetical protein